MNEVCPVPTEQIPMEEYRVLKKSWFFSWPTKTSQILYKNLFISWLITIPFFLVVFTGSLELKDNPLKLIIISIIISITSPLILMLRQIMGWGYILNRLMSDKIEYEESGWYDGQIWNKPTDWRDRDILIGQYEVRPIIYQLRKLLIFTGCLIPTSAFLLHYL